MITFSFKFNEMFMLSLILSIKIYGVNRKYEIPVSLLVACSLSLCRTSTYTHCVLSIKNAKRRLIPCDIWSAQTKVVKHTLQQTTCLYVCPVPVCVFVCESGCVPVLCLLRSPISIYNNMDGKRIFRALCPSIPPPLLLSEKRKINRWHAQYAVWIRKCILATTKKESSQHVNLCYLWLWVNKGNQHRHRQCLLSYQLVCDAYTDSNSEWWCGTSTGNE